MTSKTDIQKTPVKQPRKAAGNSVFRHPGSTGKELDLETGYSYFGARYLDNALSTAWLSIDPMSDKYPSISPYAYCSWNPVKLVDPDGEFGILTHAIIVLKATKGLGMTFMQRVKMIFGASWVSDVMRPNQENVHLDNYNPAIKRQNAYKGIQEAFENSIKSFGDDVSMSNFLEAGVNLHTIEDFYSHSNYVELYQEYVGEKNLGVNDIPLFSDVYANPDEYSGFIDKLKSELKTEIWYDDWKKNFRNQDKNSHYKMNHDNILSEMGRKRFCGIKGFYFAKSLAERETVKTIQLLSEKEK